MLYQFIYKYLCCIYFRVVKIIQDIYTVFLKNIILYYNPIELKLLYDTKNYYFPTHLNKKKISDNTRYCYLYKIHKMNQKYCKIYNYGYYYHMANLNWNYDCNNHHEIAYPPDTIEYLILQMRPINNGKQYYLEIKDNLTINKNDKFIGSVLSFTTKQTTLNILLYYYLQNILYNNDAIIDVKIKFELEDDEKNINFMDTLENIYSQFD